LYSITDDSATEKNAICSNTEENRHLPVDMWVIRGIKILERSERGVHFQQLKCRPGRVHQCRHRQTKCCRLREVFGTRLLLSSVDLLRQLSSNAVSLRALKYSARRTCISPIGTTNPRQLVTCFTTRPTEVCISGHQIKKQVLLFYEKLLDITAVRITRHHLRIGNMWIITRISITLQN